jgi:hypothetical protein
MFTTRNPWPTCRLSWADNRILLPCAYFTDGGSVLVKRYHDKIRRGQWEFNLSLDAQLVADIKSIAPVVKSAAPVAAAK